MLACVLICLQTTIKACADKDIFTSLCTADDVPLPAGNGRDPRPAASATLPSSCRPGCFTTAGPLQRVKQGRKYQYIGNPKLSFE